MSSLCLIDFRPEVPDTLIQEVYHLEEQITSNIVKCNINQIIHIMKLVFESVEVLVEGNAYSLDISHLKDKYGDTFNFTVYKCGNYDGSYISMFEFLYFLNENVEAGKCTKLEACEDIRNTLYILNEILIH